jgi:hypothetical protein
MTEVAKALVGVSALAFILAVITNYAEVIPFPTTTSEGFSRASANLALLAIALVVCFRNDRRV